MKNNEVRILLVDDQALFREGLRLLLKHASGITVVGEAKDGEEAISACERDKPDVVLMDLRMPGMDGVEATAAVRRLPHSPQVLVLTTFDHDADVFRAIAAGAIGYLLKDVSSDVLIEGIQRAARGQSVLEPGVASKVLHEFARLQEKTKTRAAQPLREPLSARELEVLGQLAAGLSNKEIAVKLHIAEGTVKNHMSQVLAKLGVLDRTQAALRARELDLL